MESPAWYQAPLFRTLPPPQRERLSRIVTTKTLEPEAMLFMEQEPCTGFYVVLEGAIQLTRSSHVPGAHPTLAVVTPVNSFAEAALFGGEAFPATATAVKPSRVAHFPKAAFLAAMREDPDLALAIIHAQTLWLRRLIQKVEQLTASDSSDRLRTWVEENVPRGRTFVLPVTKKTLAAQLGMTPETLSRGLRAMQDAGFIEVQGRNLRRV